MCSMVTLLLQCDCDTVSSCDRHQATHKNLKHLLTRALYKQFADCCYIYSLRQFCHLLKKFQFSRRVIFRQMCVAVSM